MDKLHDMEEAAELMRQKVGTLQHWRQIGYGPKSARIGRRVYYRESDIRAWLDYQFSDDKPAA